MANVNVSLSQVFAINLKTRIVVLGLTRREVAKHANVSRNTINSLCNGKTKMIKFSTVMGLAKALRCNPEHFFSEDTRWAVYKWANDYQKKEGTDND